MATFKKASEYSPGASGVVAHFSDDEARLVAAFAGWTAGFGPVRHLSEDWYETLLELLGQDEVNNPFLGNVKANDNWVPVDEDEEGMPEGDIAPEEF